MKTFAMTVGALLLSASLASAQYVYYPAPAPVFVQQPIVPVVNYSFYPPAFAPQPVVPAVSYYQPVPVVAPVTSYYAPAYVPGYYSAQTNVYGLGILRPRIATTQYYWTPYR